MSAIEKTLTKVSKSDVIEFLTEDQVSAMEHERDLLQAKLFSVKPNYETAIAKLKEHIAAFTEKKHAKTIAKLVKAFTDANKLSEEFNGSGSVYKLDVTVKVTGALGLARDRRDHGYYDQKGKPLRPSMYMLMPGEFRPKPVSVQLYVEQQLTSNKKSFCVVELRVKLPDNLEAERTRLVEMAKSWDEDWMKHQQLAATARDRDKIKAMIRTRLSVAALQGTPKGLQLIESMRAIGLVNGALTKALSDQATKAAPPNAAQIEKNEPIDFGPEAS